MCLEYRINDMYYKSLPRIFGWSDGIYDNYEKKPPASITSYGNTPDNGLFIICFPFQEFNLHCMYRLCQKKKHTMGFFISKKKMKHDPRSSL